MDALDLWGLTEGFLTVDEVVRQRQRAASGKPADLTWDAWVVKNYKPKPSIATALNPAPRAYKPRTTAPVKETSSDPRLTPELRELAYNYVRGYNGSFEFILSLKTGLSQFGRLTDAQTIGALKVLKRELQQRRERESAPTSDKFMTIEAAIAISARGEIRCAVPTNAGHLGFYSVRMGTGKWEGYTFVKVIGGPNEYPVKSAVTRNAILAKIAQNVKEAMMRFGREIGTCGQCGLPLTDETSRAIGIGPICREKW